MKILTIILAIWGAFLSTILAVLKIIDFSIDRPKIKIKAKGGYKVYPVNNYYGKDNYILINVANEGRRDVIITKVALLSPKDRIKGKDIILQDSLKKIKISERSSHDYLAKEKYINFPQNKYVVVAVDDVGRKYYSHNFFLRFLKIRRIK